MGYGDDVMRKPEQYRITKMKTKKTHYAVQVTWGLMDVETLPQYYNTYSEAVAACKAHSAKYNVGSPIILKGC